MKNLMRVAAAAAGLALAAPALPCGLTQQSAQSTTPAPTVTQAPKAEKKVPVKTARKSVAAKKTPAVARN